MSHVVIVGGSTGMGRDIAPVLEGYGHRVTIAKRGAPMILADALLFCQRFRGATDDWFGEFVASPSLTRLWLEHQAKHEQTCAAVVMASVAAVSVEAEQPVSYHVGKASMIAITKYYGETLAPRIRVNAIIPGLRIKPEARPFYDAHPELEELYKSITPLARMCTVEDIAFEVNHLIDPRCYQTGQTITLDGGIGLRSHWALARRVTPSLRDLAVTQRQAVPK